MRTIAAVVCMVLLAGCAKPVYYAPDQAQFKRDSYQCSQESKMSGGGSGLVGVAFILAAQSQAQALYEQCMDSKGYVRQ